MAEKKLSLADVTFFPTLVFVVCVFFEIYTYILKKTGPYIAGTELSLADATVFPTLVFVTFMLPKFVDSWDASQEW